MAGILVFVFAVLCLQVAHFSDPCIIELECAECLPDNMPMVTVTSQNGGGGRDGTERSGVAGGAERGGGAGGAELSAAHGDEVALACAGGKFLAYPLRESLVAVCEAGRYRVRLDNRLRDLLELGCQENVFEDVMHQVEHCGAPLQGRAYVTRAAGGGVRHLATACFDADRAVAAWLRASSAARDALAVPPHEERSAPLSILGNFNHMFDVTTRHDADRLYSDDARMTRRLREMFKHDRYTFAGQTLTSAKLLSGHYFEAQHMRVASFVSNSVAVWRSVAWGNLRHLQADVARLVARARGSRLVEVFAGTHGVAALGGRELFLRAGGRFPVPRYVWTALVARRENRGVALVLLNDPFVTVSEVRAAVFCDSTCGAVSWLADLKRHRNYERPLHGLVFCCSLPDFANVVGEMPRIFNDTIQQLN